ncbi:GNAT family N-acetyltransferase [Salipaludibacillus daqingensis]|uniref:GNAT family N-acetyltransferase n=1 Tax=Salipaludibacillus daqingensis TaxID=3041001 RepID=UPI002476865E|nr:GNAT family N-acetyltransferase [Salipaludibacillus daqingensis]
MTIREVTLSDNQSLAELLETIDGESSFMLYEKNERNTSAKQVEGIISSFLKSTNSKLLVAEEGNKLVGYIMAIGGKTNKNKHSAYLVLGVSKRHAGKGIGTKLMTSIEEWAKETGIIRLELTTMIHNESALALYRKMGFEVEGLKRRSFIIDEKSVDEYYMAKLLDWSLLTHDKSDFI